MDQNQTQSQIQNLQTLEEIQAKIADTLGVTGSTDEKHLELVDKATDVILKKIFLDTIEKLSDADAESYAKLIEAESSPAEIQKFLSEKIPDYQGMAQKITDDFLKEMKEAGSANP